MNDRVVWCVVLCLVVTPSLFAQDGPQPRPKEGDKPERFSLSKWWQGRGEDRLTPEMRSWAEQIADLDRSDSSVDWSALRSIKNQFNLFNPTPRALRREFITDRPDKTINPVTLDAGHVQIEMDLVTATFDRRQPRQFGDVTGRVRTGTGGFLQQQPFTSGDKDDYNFLMTNLRVGLTNNVDAHFFFRPAQFLSEPAQKGETARKTFGTGDIRVLLKENAWGNEGGPTALSFTQYLDIPAGQPGLTTGVLEGGATVAYLLRFPEKLYLGLETGLELRKDILTERYHPEIPASISLAFPITKELSGKAEFAAVYSFEPGAPWVGVVSLALLYDLGDDLQLDLGINLGVTSAANDFNPFVGIARRF